MISQEIWNVEGGHLTHKGKAAVIDEAFESNPNSKGATPTGSGAATPAGSTPATPAGSGDEAAATLDGVDAALTFKAAKGRKKMTRKQMKDREERRRLRTVSLPLLLRVKLVS